MPSIDGILGELERTPRPREHDTVVDRVWCRIVRSGEPGDFILHFNGRLPPSRSSGLSSALLALENINGVDWVAERGHYSISLRVGDLFPEDRVLRNVLEMLAFHAQRYWGWELGDA